MKRLAESPLDQGGSFLIEVDETSATPVTRETGKESCARRP
jgi:hypothetical protein